MGFLIHTTTEPYSILQAEKETNGKKPFKDPNIFITRRARFNRIFHQGKNLLLPREFWPFRYVDLPIGTNGITCPGYKLNPDVDIFVIAGVDRDSTYTNADIPWDYLTSKE